MLLIYHGYKALLNVGKGPWSLTLNASLSNKFLLYPKQLSILWEYHLGFGTPV
jgi:hypothetical protein